MSYTSINFILSIAILTLLYYRLPKKIQWVILLFASLLFYLTYGMEKIPFILGASLIAFLAAGKMEKIYIQQDEYIKEQGLAGKEKKEYIVVTKKRTKHILDAAVFALILLLVYAKVGSWLQEIITGMVFGKTRNMIPIIVALGVSYYTFSLIGYVLDVYWRKEKAESNYFRFLLFAIYFPKILQGPISKHRNLAPQFIAKHDFNYKNFCFGIQLALWGFFKKLVIADRLALLVNQVYGDWYNYAGAVLLLATVFSAFQIYCDFSGCMDIARGVSQIFDINLEKNFEHPFFARSAAEFWRRWHITLGAWFKDYLCMPIALSKIVQSLSRSARKKWGAGAGRNVTVIIPLVVVWIVTGLWHGTGIDYIAWGVYWGSIIIVSTILESWFDKISRIFKIDTESFAWKVFQMFRTFMIFCGGRLLTLPGDLKVSGTIFMKIITEFHVWEVLNENVYNYGLDVANFNLVILALLLLLIVSILQEKGSVRERIAGQHIVVRWAIYYVAFFAVVVFGMWGLGYEASVFAYMYF